MSCASGNLSFAGCASLYVLSSFSPSDIRREEACSKAVASQRCAASAEPGVILVWPDESARRSDGSCVHDTMDGTTATRRRDPPIDPIRGSVRRRAAKERKAARRLTFAKAVCSFNHHRYSPLCARGCLGTCEVGTEVVTQKGTADKG